MHVHLHVIRVLQFRCAIMYSRSAWAGGWAFPMDETSRSTPGSSRPHSSWRRSTHSGAQGNCVEVAPLAGDRVALRDSRQPDGPSLVLPRTGLVALLTWLTTVDSLAGAEA
jgi:hypothetical protein